MNYDPCLYILDERGNPVPTDDVEAWGMWLSTADRTVGNDTIGDCRVSTVFLGIDYNHGNGLAPILYETMVFGGAFKDFQKRYSTREEALKGHAAMIQRIIGDGMPVRDEEKGIVWNVCEALRKLSKTR